MLYFGGVLQIFSTFDFNFFDHSTCLTLVNLNGMFEESPQLSTSEGTRLLVTIVFHYIMHCTLIHYWKVMILWPMYDRLKTTRTNHYSYYRVQQSIVVSFDVTWSRESVRKRHREVIEYCFEWLQGTAFFYKSRQSIKKLWYSIFRKRCKKY